MNINIKKTIIISLVIFVFPITVFAHPGRTNSEGCHVCRTNCTEKWGLEYGEYHCHEKKIRKARAEVSKEARRNF